MASDTFDGTGALSANWTVVSGAGSRVSGVLVGSSWPFAARYTTGMPSTADQYVEATVGAMASTIHVMIRLTSGVNGYYVTAGTAGNLSIRRSDGGVPTTIETAATGLTFAAGDRIGILVIGSVLRAYYNGVPQGTGVTDATYSAAEAPGVSLIADGDTVTAWRALDAPFAELAGTATASITEADVRTGGKTIILTLTGDTFIAA
jgi:hypothetical protein